MPGPVTIDIDGIRNVSSFRFLMSRTTQPSSGTFTIAPESLSGPLPRFADVSISDGPLLLVLKQCQITSPRLRYGEGNRLTVTIRDRRWRWDGLGSISGSYNEIKTEYPQRTYLREKKPSELISLLLDALGEADVDLTEVVDTERPTVEWDHEPPARILDELLEALGLVLTLNWHDEICICKLSEGELLPEVGTEGSLSFGWDGDPLPTRIDVLTRPIRWHYETQLHPVGLEVDGSILPIDALSYTPDGGWFEGADFPNLRAIEGTYLDPQDGLEKNYRDLARKSVMRWWKIGDAPGANIAPIGFDDAEQLPMVEGTDDQRLILQPITNWLDSKNRPRPAYVLVYDWGWDTQGDGGDNARLTIYRESWQLDTRNQMVVLGSPYLQFLDGVALGDYLKPYLVCTAYVRDKLTHVPNRFRVSRDIDGGRGLPLTLIKDDLEPRVSTVAGTAIDNRDEITEKTLVELDRMEQQLLGESATSVKYFSIEDIATDGAIVQVEISVGLSAIVTVASRGVELGFPQQSPAVGRRAKMIEAATQSRRAALAEKLTANRDASYRAVTVP